MARSVKEPTEDAMLRAVVRAAKYTGWRTFHARPGRTINGSFRTPVQGDGNGFPDLVMVHERAGLLWFVELKSYRGRLSEEQRTWALAIEATGATWLLVRGREGLTALLDDMATAPRQLRSTADDLLRRDLLGEA